MGNGAFVGFVAAYLFGSFNIILQSNKFNRYILINDDITVYCFDGDLHQKLLYTPQLLEPKTQMIQLNMSNLVPPSFQPQTSQVSRSTQGTLQSSTF
jgi:hypothetical protein